MSGRVHLDSGQVAAGMRLRVYTIGFGGAILVGEATTDGAGRYEIAAEAGVASGPVEIRAVAADGTERTLTTPVRGSRLLNLVAPAELAASMGSEHRRLLSDLTPHLRGRPLATAREGGGDRDLTVLREATGWDARLIALAARAEQLAEQTGVSSEALYTMLRAGLPDRPEDLALVAEGRVAAALAKGVAAGVAALAPAEQQAAVGRWRTFARAVRREQAAPGMLHGHGAMLASAGLARPEQQDAFDSVMEAHAGDPAAMWGAAERAGLPVANLRLTGKLGYLTRNNAWLTDRLRQRVTATGGLRQALVADGLYRPDRWQDMLRELSRGDEATLAGLIPPAYAGDSAANRLQAYSNDLARRVRLAYPTEVVAARIGTSEFTLGPRHDAARAATRPRSAGPRQTGSSSVRHRWARSCATTPQPSSPGWTPPPPKRRPPR